MNTEAVNTMLKMAPDQPAGALREAPRRADRAASWWVERVLNNKLLCHRSRRPVSQCQVGTHDRDLSLTIDTANLARGTS